MSSTKEEYKEEKKYASDEEEDDDNDTNEDEDYEFNDEEDDDYVMGGDDDDAAAKRIFDKSIIDDDMENDTGSQGEEDDYDAESIDYGEEEYFKKTDATMRSQFVATHHPEIQMPSYDEIRVLCEVKRNEKGLVDDPRHRTEPFVRKYERARIIGERAVQLANGAEPLIPMEGDTARFLSEIEIASREFEQKLLPFIIFRPLPHGGGEFWKLADLETL
jgi:DNA-directed RNA polymerase I, II, and III subunit RPABC2